LANRFHIVEGPNGKAPTRRKGALRFLVIAPFLASIRKDAIAYWFVVEAKSWDMARKEIDRGLRDPKWVEWLLTTLTGTPGQADLLVPGHADIEPLGKVVDDIPVLTPSQRRAKLSVVGRPRK
jgi:hypothetical protein